MSFFRCFVLLYLNLSRASFFFLGHCLIPAPVFACSLLIPPIMVSALLWIDLVFFLRELLFLYLNRLMRMIGDVMY